MSNEVNVREIAYGTLDPQVEIEIYFWGDYNSYNTQRKRARFFSVSPDPEIPFPGGGTYEWEPSVHNLQITRVWNTVWASFDQNEGKRKHVFQSNVAIKNIGDEFISAYHLIQAETDN
jgi:hypothetical protein